MQRMHEGGTERNVILLKNIVEDIVCAGMGAHGFNVFNQNIRNGRCCVRIDTRGRLLTICSGVLHEKNITVATKRKGFSCSQRKLLR